MRILITAVAISLTNVSNVRNDEKISMYLTLMAVTIICADTWENVPSDEPPTKTQISLRILIDSLESPLYTWRNFVHDCLKCALRRFWSEAQSDLNLRWEHIFESTISDVAAVKHGFQATYFITKRRTWRSNIGNGYMHLSYKLF